MSRPHRTHPARHGFTIVELLVAVAVSGVVVLAAYSAVGFAADATRRLRGERREALAALAGRQAFHDWLRAAMPPDSIIPFEATHRGTSERPLDEVIFGVADAGSRWPGPHVVRLRAVGTGDAGESGVIAELAPLRGAATQSPETVVVARGALVGLRLRWLRRDGGRERWVDEWRGERSLPLAVEVHVSDALAPASAGSAVGGLSAVLRLPMRVPLDRAGDAAAGWRDTGDRP